jgi:DNA-binding NarL/FixJ family response regulator
VDHLTATTVRVGVVVPGVHSAGELSARQREILELVVEGLSNAEIAGRLYLSESTIKQHLRAAYKVLGVHNRTEAAKTMREHARGV